MIRIFDNTDNIIKHINNHSNGVTNSYKINTISNVNKTYYNFNGDITLNKTSNKHSNGTYNIIKTSNTFNTTESAFYKEHK